MFRGNHPARVDEKGRLKLPAEFKRRVDEAYGPQFYVIPNMNPAKKKFLDVTNYYGQMAELDAQGRLTLPQLLRESAKVTAEVVVLGAQTFLEVVNHDSFRGQLEAEPLSEADMVALAEFGL